MIKLIDNLMAQASSGAGIDEIMDVLRPHFERLPIELANFDSGQFLYRARKVGDNFNKEIGIQLGNLQSPPPENAKLGRGNRDGNPAFYCSLSKEPIFFELPDIHDGDEIVISFWHVKDGFSVTTVGYTKYLLRKHGVPCNHHAWSEKTLGVDNGRSMITLTERPMTFRDSETLLKTNEYHNAHQAITDAFMCEVNTDENYKYKVTAAIAELALEKANDKFMQPAGVLYPSVRITGDDENLALRPDFVTTELEFKKAVHVRIDKKESAEVRITYLDHADTFLPNGNLCWLGRTPVSGTNHVGHMIEFSFKPGVDYQGDYHKNVGKTPYRGVVTDCKTGKEVLPD